MMNVFYLRQLMAIFCAFWILSFTAQSSINEKLGSQVEISNQSPELIHSDTTEAIYAVDPLEQDLWNLAHSTNYQNLAQADQIESILAPDVSSIRLAELKR